MKKTTLSFDMGDSHIKIARRENGKIVVHAVQMPENLLREGLVQVPHMVSDFLKDLRYEYRLPKIERLLFLTLCLSVIVLRIAAIP